MLGIGLSLTARPLGGASFAELNLLAPQLDPRINFTRASTKTYYGADGLLHTAAANEWPLEYDRVTLQPVGRSAWEARTNLLLQGSNLTSASWQGATTGLTVTGNAVLGPDGAMSLALASADGSAPTYWYQETTCTPGGTYTFSWYAAQTSGTVCYAVYDTTHAAWVKTPTVYTATNVRRISVTVTAPVGCTTLRFYPFRTDSGIVGSAGIGMAQVEAGPTPSPYIPTTSAQVTRAADVATVNDLSTLRFNAVAGAFYVEHAVPSGVVLLTSGGNTILTSQGPGKIAVAYDASGSSVSYNGGATVAGGVLTFGTSLTVPDSDAPIKRIRCYPTKQDVARITA